MAKGMGAKAFIDFVLGAGQKIAKENGFIAL
jgi:ABC-type phosphate transport system substrate-binding protein